MMNTYKIIVSALASLLLVSGYSFAAESGRKSGGAKAELLSFKIRIEDPEGRPVTNARILSSAGAFVWNADDEGVISLSTKPKQNLLLQAEGFEEVQFAVTKNTVPESIMLIRSRTSTSAAAISSIDGDELEAYPEMVFSNILQGRIPGLQVMLSASGLGNNVPDVYIRGNHGNDGNGAIFIVDGLERTISDIVPEEVEKVEVLKDAVAKILYGPRAANGVLIITTKRGKAGTRVIRATAECGVNVAARVPEYLNAYEYVTLYNEARANDGLAPKYSPEQIEGYRNSTGPNDLLYPDVDWYDYFTRNTSTYKNFMVDMTGGTDRIRYSLILNYKRGTGFESVGKLPSLDRFNIRGNIDVKVTDYLNVFADAAARLEVREWGQRNMSSVYGALSGNRPNEYTLMISAEDLGLAPNEDGVPFFGANNRSAGNLLADMKYGGFNAERYINSMVNLGLDFDFDIFVKGLKAKAALMYDNYSYFGQGQTNIYPTYAIRGTNMDDIEFVQMRKQSLQSNQSRTSDNFNQTLGFYARADYSRVFGKHGLDAGLLYNYYQNEVNGSGQNHRNENLNLRVLYDYDQRYAIEATGSLMGSARYAKGNRHFLAYAVGASWIISNEPFLKSARGVDFLKLRASFGHLGFDRNTGYLLYETAWSNGGNYTLGEQNKGTVERTTSFVRFGKDVKWEYSNELNIGIDGSFLGHRLNVTVDGFRETRNNIVTAQTADLAAVHGGFVTVVNGGSVRNWGMDGRISWNDRVGDFHYEIGVNATWTANKLLSWNQVNYPDGGTVAVGKPTDAMFGYTALGLFGRDVALDGAPLQHFGDYGNGSIAYADTNNDGHVDSRDRTMIGNRFPRLTSGIDVRLGYKGWELFLCGTAQAGKWSFNDNSFWQIDGEDKYSVIALERYHPENNPDGKYPSLTTRSAANNFVNSTFWLQNASFFRLKDAELSYTFDFLKAGVKKLRLFVRGTNLFVISADGHLDPETVNAGVSTYTLYKTITGGASITF
ncbi:MAG: SusC/RagA family TonB-linked outer membrane protein [Candidatus Cryptobacteroides sp.]